jgi:hypothetical protein
MAANCALMIAVARLELSFPLEPLGPFALVG